MKNNDIVKEKVIHSSTSTMDDDASTGASLERFDERLKQIPKRKNNDNLNKKEIVNKYKGKVDVYVPRHVGIDEENNNEKNNISKVNGSNINNIQKKDSVTTNKNTHSEVKDYNVKIEDNKKARETNLNVVDVNKTRQKREENTKYKIDKKIPSKGIDNKNRSKYVGIITRKDVSKLNDEERDKRLEELEKEILLGLDVKLEREILNLRELVSEEEDIVDTLNNQELISKEEIKEKIERLEEILKKIKEYIEQVEVLNNNYRFEDIINLTEFRDQNIINNIVEYRDILEVNSDRSKKLSDKYKMLDNFILLYREVYIKEELLKHNYEKANDRLEEVEDRDKKYDELKDNVDIIEQVDRDCKTIIDKQNEYLAALNNRISRIDSQMVTQYRFNGINNMLTTMLMYISIMNRLRTANPAVRGAASVMATRRMLRNLARNRLMTTVNRMEYSADDLSSELYNHLDDVKILSVFIENTLSDISVMREQFENEFKGKVPGYEELEEKLNQVEMSIEDNKKKLEVVQNDINRNIEINDNKLVRVRTLNQEGI